MQKLPRRSRLLAAAAVTGALLVPAALLGGARAAVAVAQYAYGSSGSQYAHGSAAQYQYRVRICHRTGSRRHPFHTIAVSARAAAKHLRRHHGDHLGPCTGAEALTRKHHPGKGHAHGGKPSKGTTDDGAPKGHSKHGPKHGPKHH